MKKRHDVSSAQGRSYVLFLAQLPNRALVPSWE